MTMANLCLEAVRSREYQYGLTYQSPLKIQLGDPNLVVLCSCYRPLPTNCPTFVENGFPPVKFL